MRVFFFKGHNKCWGVLTRSRPLGGTSYARSKSPLHDVDLHQKEVLHFPKTRKQNTTNMAFTAEQKRKLRAEQAHAKGKPFKSRVKPKGVLLKHAAPAILVQPDVPDRTTEEQLSHVTLALERCRMEAEDLRGQLMRAVSHEFQEQQAFFDNWLKPGQVVDLHPIAKKMLKFDDKEHSLKFTLVSKNFQGNWRLAANSGQYKGRHLWIDLPDMCFC